LSLEEEATMPKSKMIAAETRPDPPWRKTLTRIRQLRITEMEQDEERCLEAMLHWRDPDRLRTHRRRSHTLVDDNPTSG
jgi:hypothetical protein